jgi:hypothetical protein
MCRGVKELTTTTIDISDDNHQESRWAVFSSNNGKLSYIGQVNKIAAPQVPDRYHQTLSSSRSNPLFLTSEGHWAKTLEEAANSLATSEACQEFVVTGGLLDLFPLARNESQVKRWNDYRVFKYSNGCWNAEEITCNSTYVTASENQEKTMTTYQLITHKSAAINLLTTIKSDDHRSAVKQLKKWSKANGYRLATGPGDIKATCTFMQDTSWFVFDGLHQL